MVAAGGAALRAGSTRWVRPDPCATCVATYDTFYRLPAMGEILSGRSRIAFPSQAEIAANLADADLAVDRWRGDWQGSDFKPGAPELIAIGGRAA